MMRFLRLIIILLILIIIQSCKSRSETNLHNGWNTPFPAIGSQSSPRCADLNGDGILDIVIGAGMAEFTPCDQGVIAINGNDGAILWQVATTDQIVGSPSFIDINQDSTVDVIIGGRSKNLIAIDGKNGAVIWQYAVESNGNDAKSYARYNFFNCQIIDDMNGDGLEDLLAANGGNARAVANSMVDRHPGTLMIVDSRSGKILAIDTVPDGLENYCSPIVTTVQGKKFIIYGTGGETFGGNLYKVSLDSLKNNSLKSSVRLAHSEHEGYIAPPTLVDLNQDGIEDIIATSHDGFISAIDGKSNTLLWHHDMHSLECNNMLVPGYFNQDSVLDLFGFFTKGNWPENHGVIEFALDGRDGSFIFKDSIGDVGFSSPVVFQADFDKENEVMIHIDFESKLGALDYDNNKEQLILFDFPGGKIIKVDSVRKFKNISTTPWIGDLDHDQKLDIITCYLKNTYKIDGVGGMYVSRIRTTWNANSILWGGYMGTNGDSRIKN